MDYKTKKVLTNTKPLKVCYKCKKQRNYRKKEIEGKPKNKINYKK